MPCRRDGLALLFVIGVLGVLTVSATCFVTLSRIERQASQQRIHATRASLLARCGIEDALARIRAGQDPWMPEAAVSWMANGRLNDASLDTYALRIEGGGFHVNGGDPAQAATLGYNAVLRRMLGTLAEAIDRETTPRHGILTEADGWALIESRPPEGWKDFDQVRRLALGDSRAKLDLLKPYLCLHAWVDRKVIRPTATEAMADQEFRSWAEIRQGKGNARTDPSAAPTRDPPDFERVGTRRVGRSPVDLAWARRHRPALIALLAGLKGLYLGEHSSTPQGDELGAPLSDCVGHLRTAEIRLDWGVPNDCEMAADRILACPDPLDTWEAWKRFCDTVPFPNAVARAMAASGGVDAAYASARTAYETALANWKAAHDALVAAYAALTAASQARARANGELQAATRSGDAARIQAAQTALAEAQDAYLRAMAAKDQARAEDTRLLAPRDAALAALQALLASWMHAGDLSEVENACRAILKANFNPNSDLNKFNPNATQWKLVDKSDLLAYSTEFSLQPLGALRVSSVGRVVNVSGRLLAHQELEAEVAGPAVARLTTQGEFVAGDLGNLALAGDETAFRTPGDPLYLGLSEGTVRTWGKGFLEDPLEKGLSLQSYPEPYLSVVWEDPPLWIQPAAYDGSLQLATLETEADASFGQPGGSMTCLGRFDDAFDLDQAGGEAACLLDALQPYTPEDPRSVLDPQLPLTLYPDGCYAEREREPAYVGDGNLPRRHGLLSFWTKPNHDFAKAARSRAAFPESRRGRILFLASRSTSGDGRMWWSRHTQHLLLAQAATADLGEVLAAFFEVRCDESDVGNEHLYAQAEPLAPRAWRLVTFYWDFEASSAPAAGELVLDGDHRGSGDVYRTPSGNNAAGAQDLTGSDTYPNPENPDDPMAPDPRNCYAYSPSGEIHRFVLGSRFHETEGHARWSCCGSGADSTIDEFAIYDFGQDPDNTLAQGLAAARFADGRYYAGTAYTRYGAPPVADRAAEWTSAPIRLPPGSRLDGVGWTLSPSLGYWLEVELLSADGAGYLDGDEASSRSGDVGEGQLWRTDRLPGGALRAHAVFRRDAAPAGPLDTPRLDDLTFLYTPAGGRPLLSWGGR